MTSRVLALAAALVCGIILICAGLAGAVFTYGSAAGCASALPGTAPPAGQPPAGPPSPSGPFPAIGRWDATQVGNAATVITVGVTRQLPARAWVIAVATAMQESSLRNIASGDRDSVGLFQQRPSQGWGTVELLLDPVYAAGRFYDKLVTIPNWQTMPLTEAAQAVQVSGLPDAYAQWEPDAVTIVQTLTGLTGGSIGPAACNVTVSPEGWTQPVHAKPGSGFRTPQRPAHDGVDLMAARGTPIHAASAGTVSRVRCNAVDARTGADWGCDRDGDPELTRGCGWYVDIDHPGGVVTRYCHMLTHPAVIEGQPVAAGDVIGVVGTSGHSSGPHLHYEVHVTTDGSHDHGRGSAVDPVWWQAEVGAPLGA
ncbi:M23 family metallopeptidase [Dactylosporangium sp. NPDC048998]|uniref:M23 family metallopeptidase n=1 Tax=Dactylosporangium sp. NPDC048998 TaxID=3363976 RepID=UPI003717B86D